MSNTETRFILPENFDAAAIDGIRQRFDDLSQSGEGTVVLDFSLTRFMDSSGLGGIVFLFKRLAPKKRGIILADVSGQPLDLIKMVRLDRSIPVQAQEVAA
ncbi:MAG: STAS domain-containing protein [Magnetovibrionaceae bacterium]